MTKRVFVGNLPLSATSQNLKDTFSSCGDVDSARIVSDDHLGHSHGIGYVEMATDSGARTAISMLDGSIFGGQPITVSAATTGRPIRDFDFSLF